VAVLGDHRRQLGDLGLVLQLVGAVLQHLELQQVDDALDSQDLLLGGARQVVVERSPVDDVAGSADDIGGLIDNDRWVSGACTDGLLAARQHCLDDAGATGGHQHPDLGMRHHRVGVLNGGFRHGHHQIGRRAGDGQRRVDLADQPLGDLGGARVRAEHDRVSGRQHADDVVDHRLGRIGGRSDRADDTEGGQLQGGQAVVARPGLGGQIFEAGSLQRGSLVLEDLVVDAAHAGLLDGGLGHVLDVLVQ